MESFTGALRSSPTATLDGCRRLCLARESSAEAKEKFFAATQVIWLVLVYKDWEAEALVDKRLSFRLMPAVPGHVQRVEDIGGDIWAALLSSDIPLLWLDMFIERLSKRMHEPVCIHILLRRYTLNLLL